MYYIYYVLWSQSNTSCILSNILSFFSWTRNSSCLPINFRSWSANLFLSLWTCPSSIGSLVGLSLSDYSDPSACRPPATLACLTRSSWPLPLVPPGSPPICSPAAALRSARPPLLSDRCRRSLSARIGSSRLAQARLCLSSSTVLSPAASPRAVLLAAALAARCLPIPVWFVRSDSDYKEKKKCAGCYVVCYWLHAACFVVV